MTFKNPTLVKADLVTAMGLYEVELKRAYPDAEIVVHCDFEEAGHVADSQHKDGGAVDFHVTGCPPLMAWLILERIPAIRGIGVYPDWKPVTGFHADTRNQPVRARWARFGMQYVAFSAVALGRLLPVPQTDPTATT